MVCLSRINFITRSTSYTSDNRVQIIYAAWGLPVRAPPVIKVAEVMERQPREPRNRRKGIFHPDRCSSCEMERVINSSSPIKSGISGHALIKGDGYEYFSILEPPGPARLPPTASL
ncbi:hypothetical protein CEXT_169861 [Caerostris extrusa]|uniref:Uncharacterized protein n=1 Tax=Caerostris extrusa TaxID=172846 RepID=A0AAV4UN73_CAEEX|nr:hypothetical protein CEXT_169861 [Caerostris extrusa]